MSDFHLISPIAFLLKDRQQSLLQTLLFRGHPVHISKQETVLKVQSNMLKWKRKNIKKSIFR